MKKPNSPAAQTRRVRWLAATLLAAAMATGIVLMRPDSSETGRTDTSVQRISRGKIVYEQHCASCHGAKLEGAPNWRQRLPGGRMPAPPHDDSGHTWHHPDEVLFGIVKSGVVPPYAPAGYLSDMPAFGSVLSDEEIGSVLAYIRSHWSEEILKARAEMTRYTGAK
ncbi:c-type cytochrome [Sulfuriferula plumbiphila]|nr:c-type cytochrome [Sulfuriferula plumbiphila]